MMSTTTTTTTTTTSRLAEAKQLEGEPAETILRWAIERFHPKLTFSNSLQLEDMVIVDMAHAIRPDLSVFTLDTGRIHQETYEMIDLIRGRYPSITLDVLVPDSKALRALIEAKGPNSFYESVANRQECCGVRKVSPLKKHFAERKIDAWVTGLRRDQSTTRASIDKIEIDGGVVKINPIADWSWERVIDYATKHDVPKHALYARGYSSIGCAPCTRAIKEGEDARAGRWWWEEATKKECGLHPAGSIVRR